MKKRSWMFLCWYVHETILIYKMVVKNQLTLIGSAGYVRGFKSLHVCLGQEGRPQFIWRMGFRGNLVIIFDYNPTHFSPV